MFEIVVPKVEVVNKSKNHGTFQIEPLEPGFGTTLGNALRRVLLSSLPGAAVNSIKIDGVYHEFSDIKGVREDVTELVLNVKQLRLRSTVDHPEPLRLEVKGVGRITAADVQCPPEVEIVNPELYLLSADSEDTEVSVEMTVQKGKGYLPADHREGLPIGVIPVDAIFTPIKKVNFAVEEMRVGVTTYERLILDVWTDETIDPQAAVAESAGILVRQFNVLTALAGLPEALPEKQGTPSTAIPARMYDIPIEDLDLTVRAYNCLKRAGITKVGQVLEMSEEDLLSVRNFGRKSLDELRERLEVRGYIEGSRLAETPAPEGEGAVEEEAGGLPADEAVSEAAPAEEAEEEDEEETTEEEEETESFHLFPEEQEDTEEEEEGVVASAEEEEGEAEPAYDRYVDWEDEDWEEEEEGGKKRSGRRRRSK